MKQQRFSRWMRFTLSILVLIGLTAMPQGSALAAPNAPLNGNFEQGSGVGWQVTSTSGTSVIWNTAQLGGTAHSGTWKAFLGGVQSETETITQTVTIAANTKMSFWYQLVSTYSCGASVGRVLFKNTVLKSWTLCSTNAKFDWTFFTLDLSAYAGQTGALQFYVSTTAGNFSSLHIDDVLFYDTFADVSIADPFLPYIKAIYQEGITSGCAANPLQYCPNQIVTRGQMAVFLERAMGNTAPNPSPSGMFSDVPAGHPFKPFIEELYNDGITTGCSTSPLKYCPETAVTRGQMAVFLERAMGNTSPNPSPTGMFSDVPPGHPFKAFIEELYNDGITTGCSTSPLKYCPDIVVTRGQMAVFIARAFNLSVP